ncbi:GNAT family N-acetyltransferase [Ferrovibrio sp.]|uniref:GNAT family N-acetyltransferase n=1 Tax=Ferrovibrio sp. TaxID=1917215 RepID=UPI003D0E5A36
MPNVVIRPAHGDADLAEVRRLFQAYADSLDFSLGFQDFAAELAELPGKYTGAKRGALLLGLVDGKALGVVGLRDLGDGIAEMKRLYVGPEARGLKLGLQLAEAVIEEARILGYQALRLDTLQRMVEANRLYDRLGFTDIPAYYHNPMPDTRYRELKL